MHQNRCDFIFFSVELIITSLETVCDEVIIAIRFVRERERENHIMIVYFPPCRIRSDHNQDNTSAILTEWVS